MLNDYKKSLASDDHLRYELLATYINFFNDFSLSERSFVESHLRGCSICTEKFNEVFDFELESPITLLKVLNTQGGFTFVDRSGEFKINFRMDGSSATTTFSKAGASPAFLKFYTDSVCHRNVLDGNSKLSLPMPFDLINVDKIELTLASETSESFSRWTWSQWGYAKYAAAATILIGISLGGYFVLTNRSVSLTDVPVVNRDRDPEKTLQKKEVLKEQVVETPNVKRNVPTRSVLAENFTPNPILENFVDQKFRSLLTVKIISPTNGDTVKNPVIMYLRNHSEEYKIVVLNNRNIEVWKTVSNLTNLKIKKNLQPGLYYWKIVVKDELVEMGKFYVSE